MDGGGGYSRNDAIDVMGTQDLHVDRDIREVDTCMGGSRGEVRGARRSGTCEDEDGDAGHGSEGLHCGIADGTRRPRRRR